MTTRIRYIAEYLYPGAFMPEEVTLPLPAPSFMVAVEYGPDQDGYFKKDGWYAVKITAVTEKLFVSEEDSEEAWVRQSSEVVGKWIVGERVHHEEAQLAGERFDILRSNIRSNSKDGYGVLTRCGNWQIASDYTEVIAPEAARRG